MSKSLYKYNPPKLNQEDINNLNSPISNKSQTVMKASAHKQKLHTGALLLDPEPSSQSEPSPLKLIPRQNRQGISSRLILGSHIALSPKPAKDTDANRRLQTISPSECR